VVFEDCKLRYSPHLPLVLKGLSFEVRAGEKVGVIGRTGAGKSSLAQALFRMVDLESGSIRVDGLDIKQVGLDTVSPLLGRSSYRPINSS
jgi:ABC-type multidrug transport system fused ATPase/permease subunit